MSETVMEIDVVAMQAAAARACALLKALGNPDRLLLLCQLSAGERTVGELESTLGIGQPTLSQQLAVLRQEQLVATRREGKQIYYSIASSEALSMLQLLHSMFCPVAEQERRA